MGCSSGRQSRGSCLCLCGGAGEEEKGVSVKMQFGVQIALLYYPVVQNGKRLGADSFSWFKRLTFRVSAIVVLESFKGCIRLMVFIAKSA
jgi:hypothetical protein